MRRGGVVGVARWEGRLGLSREAGGSRRSCNRIIFFNACMGKEEGTINGRKKKAERRRGSGG